MLRICLRRLCTTKRTTVSDSDLCPTEQYNNSIIRSETGSIRGTVAFRGTVADKKDRKRTKKGIDWSWSELANLVKFSRDPIQASLLKFDDTTEEGKVRVIFPFFTLLSLVSHLFSIIISLSLSLRVDNIDSTDTKHCSLGQN